MGRTTKPCPGCGDVNSSRAAAEVCYECKRLMEDGNKYRALTVNPDRELRQVVTARHHLPYIRHCGDQHRYAFQEHFRDLAVAVSIKSPESEHTLVRLVEGQDSDYRGSRSFVAGVPTLMNSLYQEARAIAQAAYDAGRQDGQNFIAGLAAGEMSLERFNKATING